MDALKPFPTDEPIRPEGRLIGRANAVEALARQLLDQRTNTRLAAERREGKTSLALAVLDRGRQRDDYWVLEADLSKHGPLHSAADLAQHLAEQARAAKVGVRARRTWVARRVIRHTARLKDIAATLGVDELEDLAQAAGAIDALLAPSENPQPDDLRNTLLAIEVAAVATDREVLIFIDEAHRLATHWSDADDAERVKDLLGEVMRRPAGRIVLLIAGSETRVMEALFGSGSPLEYLGMPFVLPDIAREDWIPALRDRFAEVGLAITEPQLAGIVDATHGHPQRTMRVCSRVRAYCADGVDHEVSDLAVENGIREGLAER